MKTLIAFLLLTTSYFAYTSIAHAAFSTQGGQNYVIEVSKDGQTAWIVNNQTGIVRICKDRNGFPVCYSNSDDQRARAVLRQDLNQLPN